MTVALVALALLSGALAPPPGLGAPSPCGQQALSQSESEVTIGEQALGTSVLWANGMEQLLGGHWEAEQVRGGPFVLAFTGVGCPISGKLAGRLASIHREFEARGVRFLGINANPQDDLASIETERRELGLTFPIVKDVRQELTRLLGATTTTEVFLFDGRGHLTYRGAVDDQYSLGAARPAPTENYLRDALEATLAGRPVATSSTPAPGCKLTLLPQEELPGAITWSRDIADIVARNCETCHRPGQVGPFALQRYEEAKGWASMIEEVVTQGRMPPWNADSAFRGQFSNERLLKDSEKRKLLAWIADGMPRGNPDQDPEPKVWPTEWKIGRPDAVFAMERVFEDLDQEGAPLPEEGFAVPRDGTVEYQYFTAKTDFAQDRWIRSLEIQPGAADVVHHVLVFSDDPSEPRQVRREKLELGGFLAAYAPGDMPSVYPEGFAKKLPAGATLIFQLHYTPNGKERFDRSRLALVFEEEAPTFEVVTDLVINENFRIPPGATDHEVRADIVLKEDTGILLLAPHMHTRGKDFRYTAHYPDGTSEDLLRVDYDFNWQESYILPDPLFLPQGTRLECVGHFDNSKGNPNNPDPQSWVTFGDQTWEEMFIGFFDKVILLD